MQIARLKTSGFKVASGRAQGRWGKGGKRRASNSEQVSSLESGFMLDFIKVKIKGLVG